LLSRVKKTSVGPGA